MCFCLFGWSYKKDDYFFPLSSLSLFGSQTGRRIEVLGKADFPLFLRAKSRGGFGDRDPSGAGKSISSVIY